MIQILFQPWPQVDPLQFRMFVIPCKTGTDSIVKGDLRSIPYEKPCLETACSGYGICTLDGFYRTVRSYCLRPALIAHPHFFRLVGKSKDCPISPAFRDLTPSRAASAGFQNTIFHHTSIQASPFRPDAYGDWLLRSDLIDQNLIRLTDQTAFLHPVSGISICNGHFCRFQV